MSAVFDCGAGANGFCLVDPDPGSHRTEAIAFIGTLKEIKQSLHEPVFRHYSFFVAGMLGMVSISAPFFSVHMLRDLEFSYLQYSLTCMASIATQFITLSFWGRFSDRTGVMDFFRKFLLSIAGTGIIRVCLEWL